VDQTVCQTIGARAGALRRWLALGVAGLVGCSADPPPACIAVDTSCAPAYAPTFDNIYTMTLRGTCGSQSASCHSEVGMQGGMSFQDQQHAFDALRAGRVMPGNPGCSKMIVRTDSPGAPYQMPPGDPVSEQVRCALIQWVAAGAAPGGAP
jgi:hypothetical protein